MRQILFQIPLDRPWHLGPFGDVPGFGFGLVLLMWALYGICSVFFYGRATGWKLKLSDEWPSILTWTLVAAGIVFGAPILGGYLRQNGSPPFREGIPIFGYGLMLFIGFLVATVLAARRAEREGLSGEVIWDLTTWLFIPGILGARIFYLIQYGDKVFGGLPVNEWPMAALNLSQGGIVLYGGLLGGAAGYFTFCHLRRIRPLGLADIIVPSVFVGIGFGRIGCFLNGCCYGGVSSLPWAVQFPKDTAPFVAMVEKHLIPDTATCTLPLHPTQLYSSIDGFMIAAITSWYFWHRRRNGEVLAVGMLIYPVTRFCVELLRADEGGKFGTALTISQWISIVLFLVNIAFIFYLAKLPAVRQPVSVPRGSSGSFPTKSGITTSTATR